MPLRDNELARRNGGRLELRSEPLRVRWEFPDLATADGHELRCVFTGSVRAIADRTEQRALEELLLDGRSALMAEDVARYFFPALRSAAVRVAGSHDASQWIQTDLPRRELIDAVKTAALPVAFACGLEILPPFHAELQSSTFERQRVRAMQQALAEKEAAGHLQHLQRTTELLKQYEALRSAAPELSAGQALVQVGASERTSLMQALLHAAAQRESPAALWAVAGPYLIQVNTGKGIDGAAPPKPELFQLPPTLGPLRSVQADVIDGQPVLLVGAQHGFLLIRENDFAKPQPFIDPGFESPLGFNRVIYWPRRRQFCATHGEAGLVCWDATSPAAPAIALRPAQLGLLPAPALRSPTVNSSIVSMRIPGGPAGPRNVRLVNDAGIIFSAGARGLYWDGERTQAVVPESSAEIVTVSLQGQTIILVQEDGAFSRFDAATLRPLGQESRSGRVRAAAILPWLGSSRLLVAGDDGAVQCIGIDDPLVTHYSSTHRGLRVLAGSVACVAAVSPDRQRLILWNSWDGRQPAAELFIAALARHRIADITFA